MGKINSQIYNFGKESLDLKNIAKQISSRKRDRTQSENDTEFTFSTERYSSPSKIFIQKLVSEKKKNSDEPQEEKEGDIIQMKRTASSSQEDEAENIENKKEFHPIKRTMSLPRIKFQENKTELPKIKEEEENDENIMKNNKKSSSSSVSPDELTSLSPENNKMTPVKLIRESSTDLKEKEMKDSPYDEYFFYYFNTYLEEALQKITNEISKHGTRRCRSRSEVNA